MRFDGRIVFTEVIVKHVLPFMTPPSQAVEYAEGKVVVRRSDIVQSTDGKVGVRQSDIVQSTDGKVVVM